MSLMKNYSDSSNLDSDEESQLKRGCEFCGNKTNVEYLKWYCSSTIGRVYCYNTSCQDYHESYVHYNDISKGLPYKTKQKYKLDSIDLSVIQDINIYCHYCGVNDKTTLEYIPSKMIIKQAQKHGLK